MGGCNARKTGSMIGNCAGENVRPACEVVRILGCEGVSRLVLVIGVLSPSLGIVSGVVLV